MSEEEREIPVRATSAYGAHTRKPFVQLVIGESFYSWPAEKAREIGAMLIETSLAAEADAFVFEFIKEKLEGTDVEAGLILVEFRDWRAKRKEADRA